MRYWITTHWPQRENAASEQSHEGVWVTEGKQHIISRVAPGDLVFIYESKSGRTQIRNYANHTMEKIRCGIGRQGIVALVCVTELAYQLKDARLEQYTDGTSAWWRYYAPTNSRNSVGFVSRARTNEILGFGKKYVFRGFGEASSGLKEISEDVFQRLLSAFTDSAKLNEARSIAIAEAQRTSYGGVGEGADHLQLKRRIAFDPATALNEPGLIFWKEEWPLPTGDLTCIP